MKEKIVKWYMVHERLCKNILRACILLPILSLYSSLLLSTNAAWYYYLLNGIILGYIMAGHKYLSIITKKDMLRSKGYIITKDKESGQLAFNIDTDVHQFYEDNRNEMYLNWASEYYQNQTIQYVCTEVWEYEGYVGFRMRNKILKEQYNMMITTLDKIKADYAKEQRLAKINKIKNNL